MNTPVSSRSSEPVAITMMVTGLLVAIIQALRAFGTAVTPEQEKAVVDLVANLLSVAIFVIGTFAARS